MATIKIEKRSFVGVELRAAADFCLEGIAASYNTLSQDLGGFKERIAPGAFTRSLKSKPDVKCLVNHDASRVLGRTKSGTLTLKDTSDGLWFRCELDKKQQSHNDIYAAIKRGDISECSFAFTVAPNGDTWKQNVRTLTDVDLFDVSVVTYPAYNQEGSTNVSARAAYTLEGDDLRRARVRAIGEAMDAENRARLARLTAQIEKGK